MSVDGSKPEQVGSQNFVEGLAVVDKNTVIYSVSPKEYCEWGDECRQLYKTDLNTGAEELVVGKDLEFRNFTYDSPTKTLFLTRGPGGSVAEVYYGDLSGFGQKVQRVKLTQGSVDATQGNLSLVPLSRHELAVVTGYDGSGMIEKFDLATGQRVASIDTPALKFAGVESLVNNWR